MPVGSPPTRGARGARRRRLGPDALATLVLVAIPFLVHGRALLPGRALSPADLLLTVYPWRETIPGVVPANPTLIDVAYLFHPWAIWAGAEVAHGRLPLWNPHAFAGVPFLANPQTALLFPLTWLTWVLPPALGLTLIAVLKTSIAGVGMFALLRTLDAMPWPAFVGGLTFMFNGSLAVWLGWSYSTPPVLLAPTLLCLERLRHGRRARGVAALAAMVGLALVAGYPQGAALGLVCAGAWALARCRGAAGGPGRYLASAAAAAALGAAIAAAQVLPFLEYMRESAVYAYRVEWMPWLANPPSAAVALLMPFYYGSPMGRDYWGPWNFNEISAAVGLVPWLAVPAALTQRRAGAALWFFSAMAAATAALLYGGSRVGAALEALPLTSFVLGFRLASLMAFALAAALGLALNALARAPGEAGRARWAVRLAHGGALALALLALAGDYTTIVQVGARVPVWAQYLALVALATAGAALILRLLARPAAGTAPWVGLAVVQLAALLPVAATVYPVIPAAWLYPAAPVIEHLQRRVALDGGRVLLSTNVTMLHGLDDAAGYDGMTPRRLERLLRPGGTFTLMGNGGVSVVDVFDSPIRDLLGVRRVVVPRDGAIVGEGFVLEYDGPDARVFRNERAFPRAWVVPRARCAADGDAVPLVTSHGVDLRREVVLDCRHPEATPRDVPAATIGSGATMRLHEAHRVVVDAEGPGWLVLSDLWYPGWQATVDGRAAPILRANVAFRAVRLTPGRHVVEFAFRPASVRWGAALSVAAVCVALGLALGPRVGAVGLALAIVLGSASAWALPPAPWRVSVSPTEPRAGEPITMRLIPVRGDPAGGRVDLHVALLTDWERPLFLDPYTGWSTRLVPYRAGVALGAGHELPLSWPAPRPVGVGTLLVIVAREGATPIERYNWVARPVLFTLTLRPAAGGGAGRGLVLTVLGLAAGVAVWLLALHPARHRELEPLPEKAGPTPRGGLGS